jgi:hypothetical protein
MYLKEPALNYIDVFREYISVKLGVIKGRILTEGVREQGDEENIWT